MNINDAISNAGRQRDAQVQGTQDAINRAIIGQEATEDIGKLLQQVIAQSAERAPVIVDQTIIAFDVQQFSERLSAVEQQQFGQHFGTLARPVTRGYLLRANAEQQLELASADDLGSVNRVVGFADQSGLPTQQVRVIRSGLIENPMWNFTPNSLLFLGLDGEPTQNQVGLYSQIVGFVLSPTKVFVNIQRAVIRS